VAIIIVRQSQKRRMLKCSGQVSFNDLLTHTHTHPFNGPFFTTTRVGRYQKGKTNLDFTESRDSEWQWHQLGHMQVCTSLHTDNHASTPPFSFFTGQMPFLPPNQQRKSTKGMSTYWLTEFWFSLVLMILLTLVTLENAALNQGSSSGRLRYHEHY